MLRKSYFCLCFLLWWIYFSYTFITPSYFLNNLFFSQCWISFCLPWNLPFAYLEIIFCAGTCWSPIDITYLKDLHSNIEFLFFDLVRLFFINIFIFLFNYFFFCCLIIFKVHNSLVVIIFSRLTLTETYSNRVSHMTALSVVI